MPTKKALVLGGSGLVGSHLIKQLLAQEAYAEVRSIGRRSLGLTHPKLTERILSFDTLNEEKEFFQVDDLFCCLGTTIKQAKTKQAFRQVDLVYPLQAAKIAEEMQVSQFLIVTSVGAKQDSIFFYSRVKGELEALLHELTIPALHIFQPSALLGNRETFRLNEKIVSILARPLSTIMRGPFANYRPIAAKRVANAMIQVALQEKYGTHTYSSETIEYLSQEERS